MTSSVSQKKNNPNEARLIQYAVAVSGGPDSMALLDLCRHKNFPCLALTVDHRLRPESAVEAAFVESWCLRHDIPHATLVWEEGAATISRIQEKARAARYALLTDYCRTHNIPFLLTAHHADDQRETLVLEARHGSHHGIANIWREPGVTLWRPLLAHRKADLFSWCLKQGVPFVEDPSNENERFARVQVRKSTTPARAPAATRTQEQTILKFFIQQFCTITEDGVLKVRRTDFAALGEHRVAVLRRIAQAIGGAAYPPAFEAAERLAQALATSGETRVTLAGCIISMGKTWLRFSREPAACTTNIILNPGETRLWDRRYTVSLASQARGPALVQPSKPFCQPLVANEYFSARFTPRLLDFTDISLPTQALWPLE